MFRADFLPSISLNLCASPPRPKKHFNPNSRQLKATPVVALLLKGPSFRLPLVSFLPTPSRAQSGAHSPSPEAPAGPTAPGAASSPSANSLGPRVPSIPSRATLPLWQLCALLVSFFPPPLGTQSFEGLGPWSPFLFQSYSTSRM